MLYNSVTLIPSNVQNKFTSTTEAETGTDEKLIICKQKEELNLYILEKITHLFFFKTILLNCNLIFKRKIELVNSHHPTLCQFTADFLAISHLWRLLFEHYIHAPNFCCDEKFGLVGTQTHGFPDSASRDCDLGSEPLVGNDRCQTDRNYMRVAFGCRIFFLNSTQYVNLDWPNSEVPFASLKAFLDLFAAGWNDYWCLAVAQKNCNSAALPWHAAATYCLP